VRPWEVVSLDELDAVPVSGADIMWRPIRRRFGIKAFGINAYTAEAAGEHVVEEHTEERLGHEEVYVVLRGRARFVLGDEEVDAPAGTIVYLRDPHVKRGAVAEEPGTAVLAVGGKPGEAFEPSAWEWFFAAAPYHAAGEYERGLELVREGLAEKPDHPAILYHVACYEALLGRRDEALEHLTRAIELDEAMANWAREDEDFASIRDDPRFPA
jgi:tetratricopeptide (TPR) repeat protein